MTEISAEHLTRRFDIEGGRRVTAVDDVSLKVKEGGTLAIVGPSGSGKTTLLRMLAGLDEPDEGQVLYDGVPVPETELSERGIGMVFQNYALIPQWEAERNIGFFLRLRRREREVPERVRQVSRITGVGIEHLMHKFPRQLSGGEKQRVAIARAFARDLRLLIFDEPFANLDAKFRTQARLEARRLLDKFPVTTLYVTHDQQEASLMSDRLMVMQDGRVVQVGSFRKLYDDPANLFVAQFIGLPTMNLFEGYIQDGHWHGTHFGGLPAPRNAKRGQTVTLGIRPQFIQPGGEIRALVTDVMHLYSERHTLLDVRIGDTSSQIQLPLEDAVTRGDTIPCRIDPQHILYFDTASGLRLE